MFEEMHNNKNNNKNNKNNNNTDKQMIRDKNRRSSDKKKQPVKELGTIEEVHDLSNEFSDSLSELSFACGSDV